MSNIQKLKHKDYDEALGEAHRRPVTPIGAPGLVWHLALRPTPEHSWPSDSTKSVFHEPSSILLQNRYNWRRWSWFKAADEFLAAFISNASNCKDVVPFSAADISQTDNSLIAPSHFELYRDQDFPEFLKSSSAHLLKSPPAPGDFTRGHLE